MAVISSVHAEKILDSRGDWTLEVTMDASGGASARASVPQGTSRGSLEAVSLEADAAVRSVTAVIAPALAGMDPADQESLDMKMIGLDGTREKSRLGANAMLGVSLAAARLSAVLRGVPLWRRLRNMSALDVPPGKAPQLYMNIVNGGLHAGSGLAFQEYMIIPRAASVRESAALGVSIYHELRKILTAQFGRSATLVGDEGGYAPRLEDNLEPFKIIEKVLRGLHLESQVRFGLDAAANNVALPAAELKALYARMAGAYDLAYLEDPYGENDFENFAGALEVMGAHTIIAGDDLTVTNLERMKMAADKKCINGVIIKPNQIGTLSETLAAVRFARERGWAVIASHRSAETNDDFIADFAWGVGADGIKLGAPARGERIAKYNRLMAIEREYASGEILD